MNRGRVTIFSGLPNSMLDSFPLEKMGSVNSSRAPRCALYARRQDGISNFARFPSNQIFRKTYFSLVGVEITVFTPPQSCQTGSHIFSFRLKGKTEKKKALHFQLLHKMQRL
jgi:hypothetical protein